MECFLNTWLTVLAILTTLLLGWQIITFLNIRKSVTKSINKAIKNTEREQQAKMIKFRCEAIGTIFYNLGEHQLRRNDYALAFDCFLKALIELYAEYPNSAEVDLCFIKIHDTIQEIESNGYDLILPKYVVDRHLEDLSHITDPRKSETVDFLIQSRI